jgi:uncharacterized protein (DUF1330 family)
VLSRSLEDHTTGESPTRPTARQLEALAANDNPAPFVMLNLLKFKKDGGREAYLRYTAEAAPHVRSAGAEVVYLGKGAELISGSETWDVVMLVRYPSRRAFIDMTRNPDYLEAHRHREAALERAVLYATDPIGFDGIAST